MPLKALLKVLLDVLKEGDADEGALNVLSTQLLPKKMLLKKILGAADRGVTIIKGAADEGVEEGIAKGKVVAASAHLNQGTGSRILKLMQFYCFKHEVSDYPRMSDCPSKDQVSKRYT